MSLVDAAYRILPEKSFKEWRDLYYRINHSIFKPLKEDDFKKLLIEKMGVEEGMVLFIHSSVDKLNIDFSSLKLVNIITKIVGPDGTLVFPCWHYSGRAEDYLSKPDVVFDVRKSPTMLGLLPELVRRSKHAFRSLHPINSFVAIGPAAQELLCEHHQDIYPNGEKSPLYKLLKYNSRIIGLGEKVVSLSFVHVVEDILKDKFPVKVLSDETYSVSVLDEENKGHQIETFVPHKNIQNRNIPAFFKKNISREAYPSFSYKGVHFFTAEPRILFSEMRQLALDGKTIYR